MAQGVTITPKALYGIIGVVALSFVGWVASTLIQDGNRITRLEQSNASDDRQDRELMDLRATVRDLILLSAQHDHVLAPGPIGPLPVSLDSEAESGDDDDPWFDETLPSVSAGPDDHEHELPPDYGEFQHEQRTLENALRDRGIEPTQKVAPNTSGG